MNFGEMRKDLRIYKAKTPCAYMVWVPDDVIGKATELGFTLTEEQVIEVLEYVHDKADASLGISWDTIDFWIREIAERHNLVAVENPRDLEGEEG